MSEPFLAVVFASRRGTEGKAGQPEPMYPLLGKSAQELVLETVASLRPVKISLVQAEEKDKVLSIKRALRGRKEKDVLILDCRRPLLSPGSLRSLLRLHQTEHSALTLMKANVCGREVDVGVSVFSRKDLVRALGNPGTRRKTGRSLSDIAQALIHGHKNIGIFCSSCPEDTLGLETGRDAARVIRSLRERKLRQLEAKGVLVLDPASTWVDLAVRIGRGTILYPSVVIEGRSRLGRECRIYPFVHLVNARVGDRVKILSSTMIEDSTIEDEAQVGPFTHFRPKTVLRSKARVGNFVEMKNTVFGQRSKAGHLSYLGDSRVGEDVNIGAGTITCNYDGFRKSQTIIERGAFIGSGSELVAPVRVGKNAYVGAGSTITEDVSPEALAVARTRQIEKPGWARKKQKK